jgi:hypothetical protein
MARLEVLQFSRDRIPEDEAFDIHVAQMVQAGIPLEISEFPGKVALTTVDHPDSPKLGTTVGIFVPDELHVWTVMSRFQKTTGNILRLAATQEGELTFNGALIPVGDNITLEENCKIFVHYVNDEGNWR